MFRSTFGVVGGDIRVAEHVQLVMPAETLDSIHSQIHAYEGAQPLRLDLPGGVWNSDRMALTGHLVWHPDIGCLTVKVEGEQVGVIMLDELLGAGQHASSPDALECRVRLLSDGCYVWRRGMLDPKAGSVAVYTNLS